MLLCCYYAALTISWVCDNVNSDRDIGGYQVVCIDTILYGTNLIYKQS